MNTLIVSTLKEHFVHSYSSNVRVRIACFLAVCLSFTSIAVGDFQIGYSFARDRGGGLAVLRIDEATGKILSERVLLESDGCDRPEKLRYDSQERRYVLTNETDDEDGQHLYIVSEDKNAAPKSVSLPAVPDEVRISDGSALLTCDGDWLVRVDLDSGKIIDKWNTGKVVDPAANGPQDIRFLDTDNADGNDTVVLSFQKDSRKGKKKGSRIVAFRWPEMTVAADSRLPRNRPDLHIKGNKKESGPGPEIVHISESTNRILATLDLYGAVAIGELDKFLNGQEVTWKYLATSVDGSWGDSFPDRMSTFNYDGIEVALVANSGKRGGASLFDLAKQELVWSCSSPAGLETPVYVASQGKAYSVCSGKQKERGRRDIEKTFIPQQGLFVFDLSKSDPSGSCFEQVPTDKFMFRLALVGPSDKPWIVLAGGLGSPDTLMVFDPRTGKFVDERPATGALMRFEQG